MPEDPRNCSDVLRSVCFGSHNQNMVLEKRNASKVTSFQKKKTKAML